MELQYSSATCTAVDTNFRKLNASISMYDLHKQNGVQNVLDFNLHYTYFVFPGPSLKKNIKMEAYARPIIPWKLDCDANSTTRRQLFEISQRIQKSYEPTNLGLLWGALWSLVVWFAPSDIGVTLVTMVLGNLIGGCIAIKPFIDHVKYRLNLSDDIEFYSSVTLNVLRDCSTSPYTFDQTLINELKENKKQVTILIVFYGIWLCISVVLPVILVAGALMTMLCKCGGHHMRTNCSEMGG